MKLQKNQKILQQWKLCVWIKKESNVGICLEVNRSKSGYFLLSINNYTNSNAEMQPRGYRLDTQSESTGYTNNFLCSFPKEVQCRQIQCKRKYELTYLENVIIYIVGSIAYLHETNDKSYMSGRPDILHNPSNCSNVRHGPNNFRNRTPGDAQ